MIFKKCSIPFMWKTLIIIYEIFMLGKRGVTVVGDHLSRLENTEVTKKVKAIMAEFPDEQLFMVRERLWFADMANFKAGNIVPDDLE